MNMIERLNALTPRAKMMMVIAIIVVTPLAAWAGYNFGAWLGRN